MHLLHEIDTFIATMTKLHESRQRGLLKVSQVFYVKFIDNYCSRFYSTIVYFIPRVMKQW
jgi:uncharacterized protein YecT (DUF1311 family)